MQRINPADIMGELIENGGEDIARSIFVDYLDQSSRVAFAKTNTRNYHFYNENIYSAICKRLTESANFYQVKSYGTAALADVPIQCLHELLESYKNKFPSKLDKKKFVSYFSDSRVQAINNVAFWQMVISRLLIFMGVDHESNRLNQYVNKDNLEIFKQFILDINDLSDKYQFSSNYINYNNPNLGGDLSYVPFLFLNKKNVRDALQAVDQSDLSDKIAQYMNENYFFNIIDGKQNKTNHQVLIEKFSNEVMDVNHLIRGNFRDDLIQLYVEDKISARWVMRQLTEIPEADIQLLNNEDYRDFIFEGAEAAWLNLMGSVYALAGFKSIIAKIKSNLTNKIAENSDEIMEEIIKNIKINILMQSYRCWSLDEIDDLLVKSTNSIIIDFIVSYVNNDYDGDSFGFIMKLFNRLEYWSSRELLNINELQANYIGACILSEAGTGQNRLPYALRSNSLLWGLDQAMLFDLLYYSAPLSQKLISDNLLFHLSMSEEAVKRLSILGGFAKPLNQISMRQWLNAEISLLDMILRLPSALFNAVQLRLESEVKNIKAQDYKNINEFARKFLDILVKEMGLVITYSVITLKESQGLELTCDHDRFLKYLSNCSEDRIYKLCFTSIDKYDSWVFLCPFIRFVIDILLDQSLNDYKKEEVEKVVRYLIDHVDDANVISFINSKIKGSVEVLMKNSEQLFKSHEFVLVNRKPKNSLSSAQVIKRDRDESDDEHLSDEEKPGKKPKR